MDSLVTLSAQQLVNKLPDDTCKTAVINSIFKTLDVNDRIKLLFQVMDLCEDEDGLPQDEFRESIRRRHIDGFKHPKIREVYFAPCHYVNYVSLNAFGYFSEQELRELFGHVYNINDVWETRHPYHFMLLYLEHRNLSEQCVDRAYLFPDEVYLIYIDEGEYILQYCNGMFPTTIVKCTDKILKRFCQLHKQNLEFENGLREFLKQYNLYVD